jgi:hypothetical protein
MLLHETLMADPHRQITYGAGWAIWSAKVDKIIKKATLRAAFLINIKRERGDRDGRRPKANRS